MEQDQITAEKFVPMLAIIDLKADDYAWVEFFHQEVTGEQIENVLDQAYGLALRHPSLQRFTNESFLEKLKEIHTHQLLTLGKKFDTSEYVNDRLKIGRDCALIQFPLSLVHPLLVRIRKHLVDSIFHRHQDHRPDLDYFADFLNRIFALDTYLVAEAYRRYEAEEMARSLEDLRQEAARLHHKAHVDELTGVSNYSRLMDILDHQIEVAKRKQKPLCVMMSDLDHFKKINDVYGHLAGDEVLRHVAERIQAAVRDFDVVGRFGGEEFVIILVNTDRQLALTIGERIRHEIAATPIHTKGQNIPITISIGLAMLKADEDRDSVIARADRAMYEAKRTGRNRLCVAPDGDVFH
ncbi:MAG: GGDEF domain-containing protein [Desulfuromonadales bacterium]|nr:GGDEF domain-containing protein [Desulfuromonadales bacterium]